MNRGFPNPDISTACRPFALPTVFACAVLVLIPASSRVHWRGLDDVVKVVASLKACAMAGQPNDRVTFHRRRPKRTPVIAESMVHSRARTTVLEVAATWHPHLRPKCESSSICCIYPILGNISGNNWTSSGPSNRLSAVREAVIVVCGPAKCLH